MTQTYLPQPTLAAAQARSNQQALALGCDGVRTKYWWPIVSYTAPDGSGNMAAIVITPGTPFDATTTNALAPKPIGLAANEVAKLQSAKAVASLLPVAASLIPTPVVAQPASPALPVPATPVIATPSVLSSG